MFNEGGNWVREEYTNTIRHPHLGKGLGHQFEIDLETAGNWSFDLKTYDDEFQLELLIIHGDPIEAIERKTTTYNLTPGKYVLKVGCKSKHTETGVYKLSILKK